MPKCCNQKALALLDMIPMNTRKIPIWQGLSSALLEQPKLTFSIGMVWLFHVSGMIGITLGFENWFLPKTPLNLLLCLGLLIWNYPLRTTRQYFVTLFFFSVGMFVEWVGVHDDFLFGAYYYGNSMGVKLDGVPLLIGVNWAVLTLITGTLAYHLAHKLLGRVIIGAFLMVFLDFFLEVSAPVFDFWHWELGHAPMKNFVTWFLVSAVLHLVLQATKLIGNLHFSAHLYAAQLLFFAYFYGFYHV